MRLLVLAALLATAAAATPAFDPEGEGVVFAEPDPAVRDAAGLPMWERIERHEDDEPALFRQEDFAPGSAWQDGSELAPHAETLFGEGTPSSGRMLLHFAPGWLGSDDPNPVVLVPGAGTSASGVLAVLARQLAAQGKSVFALTFAHPHGDNFQQAEQLANAIARVRHLTGAEQVDVVAHSKGGVAAAIHASHRAGVDWGEPGSRGAAYEQHGTPYDGSIRRLVLVAAPLGGLDTAFRWTAPHLAVANGADPLSPVAWTAYYPLTTGNLFVSDDLTAVDLWPENGDAFPGQAQLVAAWDDVHALPGERLDLGVYALQQDWYTTYYGGLGFYSDSPGLDAAVEAGGDLVGRLAEAGLAPSLQVAVLSGSFPFVALDQPGIAVDPFGGDYSGFFGRDDASYAELLEGTLGDDFPDLDLNDDDIAGLREGWLQPGEISGLSDGVVFADSAEAVQPLLDRGATLIAQRRANLSHLDLLFASPALGQALLQQGEADPERRHLRALGQRYIDEDTVGWIVEQLAPPANPGDDDDATAGDDDSASDDDDATAADDDDSAAGDDDDSTPGGETPFLDGCGCGVAGPDGRNTSATPWLLACLVALGGLRRRR